MIATERKATQGKGRRIPSASLLLALAAVIIFLVPGWTEALQYDRQEILAGQFWRIVTCHWTHYSLQHLFWDLVGFLALAIPCELWNRRRLLCVLIVGALLISCGNWFLLREMQLYRGLSGVDATVFGLLISATVRRTLRGRGVRGALFPLSASALFTLLFLGKLAYELAFSRAVFTPGDGTPIPLAHLIGFIVGIIGPWVDLSNRRLDTPRSARRPRRTAELTGESQPKEKSCTSC